MTIKELIDMQEEKTIERLRSGKKRPKKRPSLCEGCGQNPADAPSKLCVGCQAYREHQA
jgi:hypothetical protein